MKATIYFDGSCEPKNPGGNARGGWTISLSNGRTFSGSKFIASNSTNNVAEFGALKLAIDHALSVGATEFQIFGDSKLVIDCLNGEWMLRKPNLFAILRRIRRMLNGRIWEASWIPRHQNHKADSLSTCGRDCSYGDCGSPDSAISDCDSVEDFDARFRVHRGETKYNASTYRGVDLGNRSGRSG